MKKVLSYFLQGLVIIAPVSITVYVIYLAISTLDDLANNLLELTFGFRFPGLGILVLIVLITLLGLLSNTLIFKPIFKLFDKLVMNTPLVKIIYTSFKDLFSAFMGEKKKFDQPVIVNMIKGSGVYKLGFITQEDLAYIGLEGKMSVYLPHSYNFSGNMFVVDRELVQILEDVSAADTMKFIVSGGITSHS